MLLILPVAISASLLMAMLMVTVSTTTPKRIEQPDTKASGKRTKETEMESSFVRVVMFTKVNGSTKKDKAKVSSLDSIQEKDSKELLCRASGMMDKRQI